MTENLDTSVTESAMQPHLQRLMATAAVVHGDRLEERHDGRGDDVCAVLQRAPASCYPLSQHKHVEDALLVPDFPPGGSPLRCEFEHLIDLVCCFLRQLCRHLALPLCEAEVRLCDQRRLLC